MTVKSIKTKVGCKKNSFMNAMKSIKIKIGLVESFLRELDRQMFS